ncbi:MAG: glycosyltransferase [Lachnospiraceae bacterium]|nr:glycosyltransferase [Lachnospiraceae bacterium]
MKILQINSHYDQGGAARIVACIHRQLLANGREAYVAFGRGKHSEEANVYGFGNRAGVYLSAALSRFTGWNGYFNYTATRRLLHLMDNIQPDIIHIHVLHGYYLNVPMLFRYINKNKIPCVWTFHDCHAFVGNCGYFFECRKWENGCESCPHLKSYPVSQWFDHTKEMWEQKRKLFIQGEKIIVTPSKWLTEETKKSFFGKYPCVTIPNGIDTGKLFYPRDREECRRRYGYSAQEKLVLGIAVGYRDERKGAGFILQMAKALEKEAKVILIGWNKEMDGLLQGLSNVVTIENTRDVEVLAEYYSMADVFVIPSLAENYATTTLEAMACGTPVVGFAVGGIPEQLKGDRGIVVEAGNQEAFTEAVRKVLREPDCVLRGEELAVQIRKENSTEKMTEQYLALYQELIEEK